MNFRFFHRDRNRSDPPSPGPESGSTLRRLRRAGDEILTAGDEAIEKALSKDSQAFLRATRQQSGE